MAKNVTKLKVIRKGFWGTVAEMIGKIEPVNGWLRKNSVVWELYTATPSVDYSKTNYTLTRAIFYASEVKDNITGKEYGTEFLFGAVFGKPIVNAAAAFAFSKTPEVEISEPGQTKKTPSKAPKTTVISSGVEYTQSFVDDWLDERASELFKVARNALRDGDQYLLVKDDLTAELLPPETVEIIDNKLTGEVDGYDVTTFVSEYDKNGQEETTKYIAKYRKLSPYYQLVKFTAKNDKEGTVIEEETASGVATYVGGKPKEPAQKEIVNSQEEMTPEERLLPIIGFHNERDARERYGNSEFQNCYYLMANYHAILENAIKNNIYNSTATPIITGIDDMQKWLEANGERDENGEYNVSWDAQKLLIGGKDFDAKIIGGVANASDSDKLLNLLFWLMCQTSETPEFVMGTAVASSNASVDSQMPVVIRKAERKRKEFTPFYGDLVKLLLFLGNKNDPQVMIDADYYLSWPDIIDEDMKLNLDIVKALSDEGCITDHTKMVLLNMGKYVSDIDEEVEKAHGEGEEKAKAIGFGPLSPQAGANQGKELGKTVKPLNPNQKAIATKKV